MGPLTKLHSLQLLQWDRCPECGSNDILTDLAIGNVTYRRCELVVQEHLLDRTPEWRAYTPEDRLRKVRVGSSTSLKKFDKGLATTFQPFVDGNGKTLTLKKQITMKRLKKWNIRAQMYSPQERNLHQAMNTLTLFTEKLHIPPDIAENAALIYRKALNRGLIRGRSIKGLLAASIYAACRLTRTPRSLKEIVAVSGRSRKEITRSYRLIRRDLELVMPTDDPMKFVSKIASKAGLTQHTQSRAIRLLQRAEEGKEVTGKGPSGLAAAALYIAARLNGEKITQKKLASAAEITDVTIRNLYKRVFKKGKEIEGR